MAILVRLTVEEHLCNQLKGGNGYLGSWFQLMVARSYATGRTLRQQGNMLEEALYVMAAHE